MELGFDPLIILRLKPLQKVGIAFGLLAVITAGYWHVLLQERLRVMNTLHADVQQQAREIASKRRMLRTLPQLHEELAKLKIKEEKAAQKLPSQQEIPTLLTNISNAGHEQGLEFLLFAPGPEITRDLYAEVPVGLEVRGTFHATVLFMDQVAHLSRIVMFADMTMEPTEDQPDILITKARATTFRFLEQHMLERQDQKGTPTP